MHVEPPCVFWANLTPFSLQYKVVYTTAFSSHSPDKLGWHHDDNQLTQFGEPLALDVAVILTPPCIFQ